jgi:hypothetical protein
VGESTRLIDTIERSFGPMWLIQLDAHIVRLGMSQSHGDGYLRDLRWGSDLFVCE